MQRLITPIIIKSKETEVELLEMKDPVKPNRLQKYLQQLKTDNKKNFLNLFKQFETELLETCGSDNKNLAGNKKDLYIFVTKMLSLMQTKPHNPRHYDYLYNLIKQSSLFRKHANQIKFWKMAMTESQIQLMIKIREIAFNTLELCLNAEIKRQREDSNRLVLTALDETLTMDLFIEPLGNGLIKHSFEQKIRAMTREEEKRQGIVIIMMPRA